MMNPGDTYVALGSSFAAGPGITPLVDVAAGRSGSNYPHLVAQRLSLKLIDSTVSGATTANILREPQIINGNMMLPQIGSVVPEAALVTITIGGNDAGYIGSLSGACRIGRIERWIPSFFTPLRTLVARFAPSAPDESAFAPVPDAIVAVIEAVRTKAPDARIVLVDYLTLLGVHIAHADLPLTTAQIVAFKQTARLLEGCFAEAADRSGTELIRASAASVGHGLGSKEPWVTDHLDSEAPLHPNAAGMVAVSNLIVDHLRNPS